MEASNCVKHIKVRCTLCQDVDLMSVTKKEVAKYPVGCYFRGPCIPCLKRNNFDCDSTLLLVIAHVYN